MITTQSSTITIINNCWVIKNNASDWPHPKGGDSLYLAWDNLSAIWNRPAVLMQQPIPPKCFYMFLYVFMFLCFYVFMFLCFYVFMFFCFFFFGRPDTSLMYSSY